MLLIVYKIPPSTFYIHLRAANNKNSSQGCNASIFKFFPGFFLQVLFLLLELFTAYIQRCALYFQRSIYTWDVLSEKRCLEQVADLTPHKLWDNKKIDLTLGLLQNYEEFLLISTSLVIRNFESCLPHFQ